MSAAGAGAQQHIRVASCCEPTDEARQRLVMSATFVCQGVGVAWSSKQSKMTQPDLDFVAPDIQLAPTTTTTTSTSTSTAAAAAAAAAAASADVFSYGLLVCAVYTDSGVTCSGVFRYVQLCSGVSRCDVYTCGLLVCAVFADSGVTCSGVTGETCTPAVCWSALCSPTPVVLSYTPNTTSPLTRDKSTRYVKSKRSLHRPIGRYQRSRQYVYFRSRKAYRLCKSSENWGLCVTIGR